MFLYAVLIAFRLKRYTSTVIKVAAMVHNDRTPIKATSNRFFTLNKGVFVGEYKPIKVQYNNIKDNARSTIKYKSIFAAIIVEI